MGKISFLYNDSIFSLSNSICFYINSFHLSICVCWLIQIFFNNLRIEYWILQQTMSWMIYQVCRLMEPILEGGNKRWYCTYSFWSRLSSVQDILMNIAESRHIDNTRWNNYILKPLGNNLCHVYHKDKSIRKIWGTLGNMLHPIFWKIKWSMRSLYLLN